METLFLVIFLCKNTKEDYIRLLQKKKGENVFIDVPFPMKILYVSTEIEPFLIWCWIWCFYDLQEPCKYFTPVWFFPSLFFSLQLNIYAFEWPWTQWQDIFRIEMKRCMPNLLLKQNSIQYLWCAEPFSDNPLI